MSRYFDSRSDREEEIGRKVAQEIAMKRLEAVPEDSIDFDPDYRRSLGMIARGHFLTEADIDKMRERVLAMDFSDGELEIGGVEVEMKADSQTVVKEVRESGLGGDVLRVVDYIGGKFNRFWGAMKAKF